MSIALRNRQMLALFILAFLTILALAFVTLSTVAHIDVWHMLMSWDDIVPQIMNGFG